MHTMFDNVQTIQHFDEHPIDWLASPFGSTRWPKGAHSVRARMANMFTWIIVGLVGWVIGFLFVMVLMRMAGDEDRAARHGEKLLDPFSDVSITQTGVG